MDRHALEDLDFRASIGWDDELGEVAPQGLVSCDLAGRRDRCVGEAPDQLAGQVLEGSQISVGAAERPHPFGHGHQTLESAVKIVFADRCAIPLHGGFNDPLGMGIAA